jgi:zinc carboxypeptidase
MTRLVLTIVLCAVATLGAQTPIPTPKEHLALAEGLTDAQARALAKERKAVVWIDGGLHASEVLGAQQLAQMIYEMVSRTDEETLR